MNGPAGVKAMKSSVKRKGAWKSSQYWGLLWILPAFALVAVFRYYPIGSAFYYSLTDWTGGENYSFLGFANYAELLSTPIFYRSFLQMAAFTLSCMLVGNISTIILAEVIFNLKSSRISSVFKFLFVLPAMVPGTVVVFLWGKFILSGADNGLLNSFIALFGAEPIQWFADERTVFWAIILYEFPWVGGTSFLIYLAGMYNIPDSVIEASKLDGLSTLGRVFQIDLPLIRGQLKYFIVMGIIQGVQGYTLQYSIINPTADYMQGAMVPGYYMYYEAFERIRYGYTCAIGIVLFLIILIITIINNKFIKSEAD